MGKYLTESEKEQRLKQCIKEIETISPTVKITSDKYVNSRSKLDCLCLKCGNNFSNSWSNLQRGQRCPYCCRNPFKANNTNSIRTKAPDLIKYLKCEDDSDILTPHSNKKVNAVCPDCGFEKSITPTRLSAQGFGCVYCSDGISTPEKLMGEVLTRLKVEYETQYNPHWIGKKKYDFYIPSLNIIIETHGIQHYKNRSPDKLIKTQINDINKKEMAIKNGIIYVVIDCRWSTLKWLKSNIINSLDRYFKDIDDIDWNQAWVNSQSSFIAKACKIWNERDDSVTVKSIANDFHVHSCTVSRWLNRGKSIGLCDYNGKEENKRFVKKPINQYSKDGVFIKRWESGKEASLELNIPNSSISYCGKKKLKFAGGFIWEYSVV